MPELIQFRNGSQILNSYDALGRKLNSRSRTCIVTTVVPIGDVSDIVHGTAMEKKYKDNITQYCDNYEYTWKSSGSVSSSPVLSKIHNSEGYKDGQDIKNDILHYFRRDHLGNVREVWKSGTPAQTVQRMQYYPSGLPWADCTGADYQNRKYNGKEFIEMHGLDEYDSEARWYYPAIMRTTTIDPLAEKYYSISPYAWCGNNPVRYIDPEGMWYDDYTIDRDGYIKRVRETSDKYDMLYTKKDYDSGKTDNGLKLDKEKEDSRTILADLGEKRNDYDGNYAISTNKEQSFEVFLFAANNSDVEWSISGFGKGKANEYLVGTLHRKNLSQITMNDKGYNEFNMIFSIHSHPSITGTRGGSNLYGQGDIPNMIERHDRFVEKGINPIYVPKEYVYHKYGKALYNYTPQNPSIYVRLINRANDLYRGLGF